jgi:hypothetical protein
MSALAESYREESETALIMNILADSSAIGNIIGWVVAGYALLTLLIPLCIFTIMKRCDAIHQTLLRIEAQGRPAGGNDWDRKAIHLNPLQSSKYVG